MLKKGKFRIARDGMLLFWCKGCKRYHGVYTDSSKPVYWNFNNDYENPTFTPSILVRDSNSLVCHSFITDGNIQYLSDCSHDLANTTVKLELPIEE